MSTSDDNAKQISPEAAGEDAKAPSSEIKNKEQGNGSGGPVILFFILGLAVSLILGWVISPELLYSQKKQPVDYNHALHVAEVDDECESCHFFRADGTFSGVRADPSDGAVARSSQAQGRQLHFLKDFA